MVVAMGQDDLSNPPIFNDVWVPTNANGIANQSPIANAGAWGINSHPGRPRRHIGFSSRLGARGGPLRFQGILPAG